MMILACVAVLVVPLWIRMKDFDASVILWERRIDHSSDI